MLRFNSAVMHRQMRDESILDHFSGVGQLDVLFPASEQFRNFLIRAVRIP